MKTKNIGSNKMKSEADKLLNRYKKVKKNLVSSGNVHKENQHRSNHKKFYCTVCHMKTFTFHDHGPGKNVSSTARKIMNTTQISEA